MDANVRMCPTCDVGLVLCSAPHSSTQCREAWHCLRCKYEEEGDLRDGEVHVEPEYTLTIIWNPDELTTEKIKTLREIDPRLARLSAVDAVAELRRRETAGVFLR